MKQRYVRNVRKNWKEDPYPASGRSYEYVCPDCGRTMELHDLRDGDQAYWCHGCSQGHRAGQPPLAALRRGEDVA
ncbi:hypothetical protein GCM10017783_13660 [Deinococcus piscis]|uniref:Uncharacterized protein n=1 Tax=Deinococcus piscis TaxID=394230 RepID=A0ABQ3K3P5_9DEIO|nr:hypothetical protein [Deinococcus piscis]GHG02594.1 hypothetical protein GCM10017783_13660 [Deinococcus piscis]